MTRYLVILAAVLIGSVVGPYDQCRLTSVDPATLTRGGDCKWFDVDGGDECSNSAVNKADDDCPNAPGCAAAWCEASCDCPCDHKCYLGCQSGDDQQLFERSAASSSQVTAEKTWCDALGKQYLDFADTDNDHCDGGVCGSCGEPWCAQLDVIESDHVPTDGMCGRGIETYDNNRERICTKNIRENCTEIHWDSYYLLGADPAPHHHCELPCGYPFKCNNELRAFQPLNGITAFADLCTDGGASFSLTRGACDNPTPTCGDASDYEKGGYGPHLPTHVLSWDVMRVANSLCDDTCGFLEARLSEWGPCASGRKPTDWNPDQVCFVAVDHYGNDIGTCGLGDAGVRVHECNGDGKDICECDDPEDYEPETYEPKTVIKYKDTIVYQTHEPEYVAYEADTLADSASTYTVLSVAGIALAHAML